MIEGLDNKMLFGALGGLRLAPHVREGQKPGAAAPTERPVPAGRGPATNGERLTLSPQALRAYEQAAAATESTTGATETADANDLDRLEQQQLREMQQRDQEVRAHEQAHRQAAAGLALSAPSYQTERGPDGRTYAVGGEVRIDVSEVPDDARATLHKAQRIRAAALAPADPSSTDRQIAARAAAMAASAQAELATTRMQGSGDGGADPVGPPAAPIPLDQAARAYRDAGESLPGDVRIQDRAGTPAAFGALYA